MKVKLGNQNIVILCRTFLLASPTSCDSQSQSNKENRVVHTKTNSKLLKFTTSIRSFLEDNKRNIWFGSDREGVCLLHNGKFQKLFELFILKKSRKILYCLNANKNI